MGRLMVVMLVALSSQTASASPATVCLKDGSGVKCLDVQSSAPVVNAGKVNALLRRASRVRQQMQDLLDVGNGKAGELTGDVFDLKKKVADMEKALQELGADAKTGKADSALALKKLAELEEALAFLGKELSLHRQALVRLIMEKARRLEQRRVNLEVGAFGALAYEYGPTGGGLVSLALPMGESGLWTTRLSAGLGVSPTAGLGWLAMGSLTRTFAKGRLALGPAVLGLGDEGELLSGNQSWLLAGGAELRLELGHVYLVITPFFGVMKETVTSGQSIWTPATYKPSVCGPVLVKAGYWTDTGERTTSSSLSFTGGGLVSLAIPLF